MKAKFTIKESKNGSWDIECEDLGICLEGDGDFEGMLDMARDATEATLREMFGTAPEIVIFPPDVEMSATFTIAARRPETSLDAFIGTADGGLPHRNRLLEEAVESPQMRRLNEECGATVEVVRHV
ncbi:MAG TPA: hypothetical protein HA263_07890 [Methanoregulaceae archaeon]|nr:hypothetical protein [Methanoregulaceae archaeon]